MGQRATLVFDQTFEDLSRRFNASARVNAAKIPVSLYNDYLDLYRRSEHMHEKLVMVMEDGEHQLCMEEGRGRFRLPEEGYLEPEVRDLKNILKSFQPYYTARPQRETVWLERDQIQGFFNLFSKDYDIVHSVLEMLRVTDYLPYHRHLKEQGIRYAGPTSLQEIVNVFVGVARTHGHQSAYIEELWTDRQRRLFPN